MLGVRRYISLLTSHVSLLASLAAATPAHADFLGDTLKPFASVTEMYDSNIFRVKDREELKASIGDSRLGDFITVASVGTGLRYRLSQQELDLLVRHDFIRYGHYTDQDADRDEARGGLSLLFLDSLRIRLDGSYVKSPEARTDYKSVEVNRRRDVAAGVAVGYEMTAGLGLEGGYRRLTVDYSLPRYRTSEHAIDRYTGTVYWRLSPSARVYASYQRDETEYDEELTVASGAVNNSSSADSIRIGLEKTFSPKTAVSCSVGYLDRRHKGASARDFSGVIGRADVTYGATAKLGLILSGERQLYEETYTSRIYSVTDMVSAAMAYQVSEKVKLTVSERLTWKDFRDVPNSGAAPRSDFMQELSAGIEWAPIKGLAVSSGYTFSSRSSDEAAAEFDDHTVMTSLSYRF